MRDINKEMEFDPIREARRYVDNAHDVLRKHGKLNVEDGYYEDSKYVKAAGNYLWSGVLIALDAVFCVKKEKQNKKGDHSRVDIDDYLFVISRRDKKLLSWVKDGYQIMHLYMTYDGIQRKSVCKDGFVLANDIINRCEMLMAG